MLKPADNYMWQLNARSSIRQFSDQFIPNSFHGMRRILQFHNFSEQRESNE